MGTPYYNYNYEPEPYPVIGSHDLFGSDDLGYQGNLQQQAFMQRSYSRFSDSTHDSLVDGSINPQYMQRTESRYSAASSPENQLCPSDQFSPRPNYTSGYSNCASTNTYYQTAPPYDYRLHPAPSTTSTTGSYVPSTPRNGTVPHLPQMMNLDSSPVSPMFTPSDMQLSSAQNEKAEFVCLHHGCKAKPFARNADLKRHMDHRHGDVDKLQKWFCDRNNCPRSEKGYQAMLDRMSRSSGGGGSSSLVAAGSGPKDNGVGPFLRKDHWKAHLRDIHKEALWKRDPKSDPNWLDGKIVDGYWWRCPKCLARVYIKKNGWKCPCGMVLEGDVLDALSRKMKEARQKKNADSSSRNSR